MWCKMPQTSQKVQDAPVDFIFIDKSIKNYHIFIQTAAPE